MMSSPKWPQGARLLLDAEQIDEAMAAVKEALLASGASRVITVVAVKKMHDRGLPRDWVDDAALEVPDEYVFGFGMDLDGLWRQLDTIWSVS